MPIVSTGVTEAGLKSEFFARYDARQVYFQDLCTRVQSTKDSERYRFLGQTPAMREWGTGRLAKGVISESYDVENFKYESTIEVDRDELDDDQTGQIRLRIGELADHAATHKDWLIGQLLINGATAGFNAYDGKTFFANDHESGSSGVQDNTLTFDATDHTDVTSAEFRTAFGQALQRMLGFKNTVGESMRMTPAGLAVMVPPALYVTALEALTASVLEQTTNVLAGAARIIPLPDLTDGTKFYLLKLDSFIRPLIFQDRMPVEFSALEQNSETGFTREVFLYGVRARYRITYGYWQYAIEVTFN